jgi:SAM-dependent methyltransferase
MKPTVIRPGVRRGYDLWAETYDTTENPLVFLDRKHTIGWLAPRSGERILDVGCGTGVHLAAIHDSGAYPFGLDFSHGMLSRAALRVPGVPVFAADLHAPFPLKPDSFDGVLCALVSEHLRSMHDFCEEVKRVLRPGGRFDFSAFHPAMAEAGTEANFKVGDVEYRLGAELHTLGDYRSAMERTGFQVRRFEEYVCDDGVVMEIPRAAKYLGRPMLLLIEAVTSSYESPTVYSSRH